MTVSEAGMERLYAAAHLVNKSLGMDCLVIDSESTILHEVPADHLKSCFCQRLGKQHGKSYDLDHFYNRCEEVIEEDSYVVYSCPFGLTNVIIPAFKDDEFVGALQVGPILTKDPESIIAEHGFSEQSMNDETFEELRAFLREMPHGSVSSIISIAKIVESLVSDSNLVFELPVMSSERMAIRSNASLSDANAELICSVQDFVQSHYTDTDISLEAVAKGVYVHPSHVSRIFSNQFNCHFRSYINVLRINDAADMLANTDKPIGEIYQIVGFSDQSYFNRVFRQLKGITPSKYRAAARRGEITGPDHITLEEIDRLQEVLSAD